MMRIVTAEEALTIIKAHNALGKNVATINPSNEKHFQNPENHVSFLIRQLDDPENIRPVKALNGVDRTCYYDSATNTWKTRIISGERGRKKETAFTKKTSTSLVSPTANIQFYPVTHGILFLFDLTKCKIKPAHIYNKNIVSDNRPWLHHSISTIKPPHSTTILHIQESQKTHQQLVLLPWSEILASISKDAMIGIVPTENDLTRRLNAYYQTLLIQQELTIKLPVLIEKKHIGYFKYTDSMLAEDLKDAATPIQKDFANNIALLLKSPIVSTEQNQRRLLKTEQMLAFTQLSAILEPMHAELNKILATLKKVSYCVIPDKHAFIHELTRSFSLEKIKSPLPTEQSPLAQSLTRAPNELTTADELRQYLKANKATFKEITRQKITLPSSHWWKKFAWRDEIANPLLILADLPSDLSEEAYLHAFYLSLQDKTRHSWLFILSVFLFCTSLGIFIAYLRVAQASDPSCDVISACSTSSESSEANHYTQKEFLGPFSIFTLGTALCLAFINFDNHRTKGKGNEVLEKSLSLLSPMVRFFQRQEAQYTQAARDTFSLPIQSEL